MQFYHRAIGSASWRHKASTSAVLIIEAIVCPEEIGFIQTFLDSAQTFSNEIFKWKESVVYKSKINVMYISASFTLIDIFKSPLSDSCWNQNGQTPEKKRAAVPLLCYNIVFSRQYNVQPNQGALQFLKNICLKSTNQIWIIFVWLSDSFKLMRSTDDSSISDLHIVPQ